LFRGLILFITDLAVIFRPGLISHPNHEMSPKEHALSQEVLEFLIAQQDWFMLDIPPPPQSESGSPNSMASWEDDVVMVPSSDENDSQVGGGWKPVGKPEKKPKTPRRRTTVDTIGAPTHP
jgi:GTPase-activating protein SAC7